LGKIKLFAVKLFADGARSVLYAERHLAMAAGIAMLAANTP